MMTPEPLKSAIPFTMVANTSLVVPSGNIGRSGQQRVLEQVQTMKRTKVKQTTRNGTGTLTPSSPTYDSVFTEYKSLPVTFNGSPSFGNGHSKRINSEKTINRQTLRTAKGSTMGFGQMTTVQHGQHHRSYGNGGASAGTLGRANTSRSEPDLGRRFTRAKVAAPPQRLLSNRSSVFLAERAMAGGQFVANGYPPQPPPQYQPQPQPHSQYQLQSQSQHQLSTQPQYQLPPRSKSQSHYQLQGPPKIFGNSTTKTKKSSQFVMGTTNTTMTKAHSGLSAVDSGFKTKVDSGGPGVPKDLTMGEAVLYLSSPDPQQQHCGASFIQHSTYVDDKAKQEVHQLAGIPPLVALLRSPNPQVQQTASAALRNLSFKDTANKEELQHCGGLEEVVALLRGSDSVETHKQLTGLLWNMSSVESLRPDLVKSALPALMEKVVLPYTTGPDRTNADPEVFYHTTGCLRNFSSGKQSIRQSMRKCRGLVDSLVSYVGDCVAANRPDDKSVENCACVLHNLTFQLEAEAPTLFSRITALGRQDAPPQGDTGPIGCFSPQSSKALEAERHFDYPVVEDQHPTGAGWLIHSKTLESYLALLGSSQKDDTLEACCGALQNLTAHPGIVSNVISQTVVKKLNGLSVLAPLLRTPKINLQRNTVALVANLAKNHNLCTTIARKALPELYALLGAGTDEGTESDDTLSVACQTAHVLTMKEQDMGRKELTNNMVHSLHHLSKNNHFPKSSKAAALLLYSLWSDKDMQSFLKKKGMSKNSFMNSETIAAHRSVQVVD